MSIETVGLQFDFHTNTPSYIPDGINFRVHIISVWFGNQNEEIGFLEENGLPRCFSLFSSDTGASGHFRTSGFERLY